MNFQGGKILTFLSVLFGPDLAESAVLLSRWIPSSYLYNFKNYIFEIRTLQGSKWYITCLPPFNFNLYVFIIWGAYGSHLQYKLLISLSHFTHYFSYLQRTDYPLYLRLTKVDGSIKKVFSNPLA